MEGHIFISYSRADAADVKKLYDDLMLQGLHCWLDVVAIPTGADWDKELQKAIETCAHFVVICTPNSMASRNVQAEWQYAFELKKPLYPFVLQPCEIPFRLRIYQHIEVFKLGYEQAIRALADVLPSATTPVVPVTSSKSAPTKVDALIKRSVENWKAFGLLLDAEAFNHIDSVRDELELSDPSVLNLLYLSARRNHRSVDYWGTLLKANTTALDTLEDILLDQIDERFSYARQLEFEKFASTRLIGKSARLLDLLNDEAKTGAILDSLERIFLNHEWLQIDMREIEVILLRRFDQTPVKILARALGWMNSQPFLQRSLKALQDKPLTAIHDDAHLYGLVYMTDPQAIHYLSTLTTEGYAYIPASWFTMGDLSPDKQSDYPLHEVFVPSFWLAKIPVTIADYRQLHSGIMAKVEDDLPIHNVSWRDAMEYVRWLRSQQNLPIDLPTEAMWEKAATWDSVNQRKMRFPWGDEPDKSRCNTIESRIGHITSVHLFSPQGNSPDGIQDMVGNVFEWTSSSFSPYPYHARDGREGNQDFYLRVLRGSSFYAKRGFEHGTTTRIAFDEPYAFQDAGFRIALVIAL